MDLSLSLKKAKLGERKTGRTRKKRRCKKTDRSSRKSSNSPTRCDAAIRKSTQRPAARSFYCNDRNWKRSRDSIRRSCNRSKRTARKIVGDSCKLDEWQLHVNTELRSGCIFFLCSLDSFFAKSIANIRICADRFNFFLSLENKNIYHTAIEAQILLYLVWFFFKLSLCKK